VSSAFILPCARPGALLPPVRSRLTRWDAAGDGGAGPDDAHAAAADAVLTAIDGGCEQSLLLASLACDTLDREQTALMLDRVRGRLLRRLRGEPDPPDAARLLDAARALGELRETLARNAGVGHVCGAMAAILSNTIKTN
ncbi:MAG: hypothetical protein FWH06_06735, partial [Oscillospiraceae bacterium]|nr:hypothetical protein [Oscillospiraceae bacterium]